ncbi:MAG: (2Fe-2S)-binding protein [Acidimicrobiales bacterium]
MAESLDRVVTTVDYLRVTVGPTDRDDWLPCTDLVSDPDRLRRLIRSTAADRGTDRDDVALSLFVQGYAFRVASVVVGAWLLDDMVIDADPSVMSIALGRNRPNAVHLAELRTVPGEDSLATLHQVLVEGHLAPFVVNAKRVYRVGYPLLWSNVGAACAASFGAFMGPRPDLRAGIRDRFEAFLAAGRPELAASGRIVHLGPGWAWERAACCLFYKTDSGFLCEDCSLVPDDERQARYTRILAESAAETDPSAGETRPG